jgi:hypothetical protein
MGSLPRPRSVAGWVLAATALIGVALRVYASVGLWPADLSMHDTAGYVLGARRGVGWAAMEPSGYPIFLRVLHAVTTHLASVPLAQHVLGMASGALLYLAVRRLGAPAWIAVAGAAAIWLNGDQILLEQVLLTEALFIFLLTVALYAVVASRDSDGFVWPVVAGASIVAMPFVRGVADPLVILLGGFLLFGLLRTHRRRLPRAAAALAAGLIVLGAYSGIRHHDTGSWSVSPEGGGWSLYARVAQFADCTKFTPPAGTRPLCESTPPSKRFGVGIYSWYPQSPAIKAYGEPPRGSRLLSKFGIAAIEHQPGDYAHAVFVDLARFVDQNAGHPKVGDFGGPNSLSFRKAAQPDPAGTQSVRDYYHSFRIRTGGANALASYQDVMRVHGWLLAVLALLGLVGVVFARGSLRYGALLMWLSGAALIATPAIVNTTTWRYSVPAAPLLVVAGAIGAATIWPMLAGSFDRLTAPRRAPATP